MRGPLRARVAVVVGAATPVGAAASRALARAGAQIVLADAADDALGPLADDLAAGGCSVAAVLTDVTSAASMRRLIDQTLGAFGRLDVALNVSLPVTAPAPLASMTPGEFDLVSAHALRPVFLAMKYEIPPMLRAGGGTIVNIAPAAAAGGRTGWAASQAAVAGLTRAAALDYAGTGIQLNSLVVADAGPHPNGRPPKLPEDVAHAALRLCTGTTGSINGARSANGESLAVRPSGSR